MTVRRDPSAKRSRRLSTQDASFVYGETHSAPLHIGSVNFFDGPIDHDELTAHMEARIHLLPRYRQRLTFVPFNLAHATLEDDPDFDIRHHIKCHLLPHGISERELMPFVMREFAPILDRNRPLWQMHLFRGLENGRSAVLWKVHHCLVDGISGMELLAISLDFRPDAAAPEPPAKPFKPGPIPGSLRSFVNGAIDLVQDRVDEARRMVELIEPRTAAARLAAISNVSGRLLQMLSRPIVAAPWNASLVGSERVLLYLKVPFSDLRAIRNALGGTANDAVLAILGEAAARYLEHHKVRTDAHPLRIGCPVNVRRESENGVLGNRVSMMFPELLASPMNAEERLRAVTRETTRIKMGREPQSLELLLEAASAIPASLMGLGSNFATTAFETAVQLDGLMPALARMIKLPAPGINFIATNVPGAQVPMYLAGRQMTDMVGCVPLGANLGYNVAIVSYNQSLIFAMMAEPRLMPDVDLMRSLAAEIFEQLRRAALKPTSAERRSDGRGNEANSEPEVAQEPPS